MRNMSRIWTMLVVGATFGVTIFWSTPANTAPLTTVDSTTFNNWLGPVVGPPMTNTFDFVPSPPGPDGEVTSAVFAGAGDVSGLYVYVYQIRHYSNTSEGKIEGMSFDLLGPWAVPSVLQPGTVAFQVEDTGNKSLSDASITPGPPGFPPSISFTIPSPFILPGETSWVFGFFSPMPPTTTVADMRDTGNTILSPIVYTPSPEPSAFVLLGMGLLGGIWWRRRFK